MIKHALAALLGIAIGWAGSVPAGAATLPLSGIAASAAKMSDDTLVRVGGGRCFEEPVTGTLLAFFELLRDEEFDRHCDVRFDGDHYYRHTHKEPKYPSYKDGGYEHPKDLKAAPRY